MISQETSTTCKTQYHPKVTRAMLWSSLPKVDCLEDLCVTPIISPQPCIDGNLGSAKWFNNTYTTLIACESKANTMLAAFTNFHSCNSKNLMISLLKGSCHWRRMLTSRRGALLQVHSTARGQLAVGFPRVRLLVTLRTDLRWPMLLGCPASGSELDQTPFECLEGTPGVLPPIIDVSLVIAGDGSGCEQLWPLHHECCT